jgi:hypothetical protein
MHVAVGALGEWLGPFVDYTERAFGVFEHKVCSHSLRGRDFLMWASVDGARMVSLGVEECHSVVFLFRWRVVFIFMFKIQVVDAVLFA